jgi:hypothetical protein
MLIFECPSSAPSRCQKDVDNGASNCCAAARGRTIENSSLEGVNVNCDELVALIVTV